VKAAVLMPRMVMAGWGQLEEIRNALVAFKKSGKPLFVYLRFPGTREYYLATAADKIHMTPEDLLYMKGLRAEMMFFRKTLDKIGVTMEVEHAGKYKDAGDIFERSDMSPETKEVLNSVLDRLYGHLTTTIAASRRKSPEEMKATMDKGPFLPQQSKAQGLVDELVYNDQFFDEVKKKLGQKELNQIALRDYARVPVPGVEGKSKVALLIEEGEILRVSLDLPFGGDGGISPAPMIKILRQVGEDKSIRGVVLRVDSPGGDAMASDEILREVKLLSKKKPLVISMGDVAASGGYYIAMSGDTVVAYPNTITGSVGVVFTWPHLRGLYEKLGISKDSVSRGKNADIDSDYLPVTENARKKIREGVESFYKTFVTVVAYGRKKKYEEIEALAQGRVWLGSQAKENGLVDELGGLERAFELLKQKAKIPAAEKVRVVVYPPRRSLIERLLSKPAEGALESLVSKRIAERMKELLGGADLGMLAQRGYLYRMPFDLTIH
jgi:protease-4